MKNTRVFFGLNEAPPGEPVKIEYYKGSAYTITWTNCNDGYCVLADGFATIEEAKAYANKKGWVYFIINN